MTNQNVFMSRRNARGYLSPARKPRQTVVKALDTPASVPSKACSKCGQVKPLSRYYRDSRAKDGHKAACKVCSK